MAEQIFPNSKIPIRRTIDLLPQIFKTQTNDKFMAAVVDPLVQPGQLEKTVGYVGKRFGKTYKGSDIYLDSDDTLRSRYQLEPGVILKENDKISRFYDYLDFKNQLKFFYNDIDRDDIITSQDHYSWDPPIEWDKFVNFREYYWLPEGPPAVKVLGQGGAIVSTYRIRQGPALTWIFQPDGLTNNPTITLYRGQTYKFQVNSPGEGFTIRTAVDTGSLLYRSELSYVPKQLAVFEGQLYRAKTFVPPSIDGIIEEGDLWELVLDNIQTSRFDYDAGVTNNGAVNGTLTFEVPLDSPDVLFYQSAVNPDRFGRFVISDIESNTKIDVEKEIIGKDTYTSSNGIEFTNGLIVRFAGQVSPKKYASDNWLVENVGREIKLIKFSELYVPIISNEIPEVLFDNNGFDNEPFDDATAYPIDKDYITICRASIDSSPWSRYNRWFHRSVIEFAHGQNGTNFDSRDESRAKRPIIEFKADIQLFNHGSVAKQPVDLIDTFTDDIFSKIEGSLGYNVDGEFLYNGARVLFINDSDPLANNRIYRVEFITHNSVRQITLRKIEDSEPLVGECVLVRTGRNKGKMYHFDGTRWILSQEKTAVNQPPLFDLYDENGISFADEESYPVSSFQGSKIIGYKTGNTIVDAELGFALSYLNIDNVGDILFEYLLDKETFSYTAEQTTFTKNINGGFYRFNPLDEYRNDWTKSSQNFLQPILDSTVISENTDTVELKSVNWDDIDLSHSLTKIIFYLNGQRITNGYTRTRNQFKFSSTFKKNDVLSVKIYADVVPVEGYYQLPVGLERNPLNSGIAEFTLGQAIDHISMALETFDGFVGAYPGVSNLRDIDGYQDRCIRFIKHSGLAPTAISLLADKDINVVKALQFGSKAYNDFKNEFIRVADSIDFQGTVPDFVDAVISQMGETKNSQHPFADSDMIGSGANTKINYKVEDPEIKVFALSKRFDLSSLSRRAVYVYLNDDQLLVNRDYTFDITFGFVRLTVNLQENDLIEIREYVSTSFCYIPPTPTKLGLYKKYTPRKFLDDTFIESRLMIEGHDGSLLTAYDDFKDDLILELEHRIYNNIKQEYNETLFDIDKVLGGFYETGLYTKRDLDNIVTREFLKWVSNTELDYTDNLLYFDSENSFTYTYSNMTDITGTSSLPGHWRGVYLHFYDTVRPHTSPWEMLGFSEKPQWWEDEYGPAPYTRDNLLLWEDLRDGVIRQGLRAGTHARYTRPSILNHIPTDGDGNLLSPLDSGLATNFTLINNKGPFNLGDVSPVEYAWRSSSEWPFAVTIALCLLKPFEFITDNFDRSRLTLNQLGQTVSSITGVFQQARDYVIPAVGGAQVAGLCNFVSAYIRSRNQDPSILFDRLNNLDVRLSTRLSGFVDQTEQKYLLDSKSPQASSSNIFVPPENYDIIFNVGVPFDSIAYSGMIIEKVDRGWKIRGYDSENPVFPYFRPIQSTTDPIVTVGGVSAGFAEWTADSFYGNGIIVRYQDKFYRSMRSHTSSADFDISPWKQLPALPLVGALQAAFRKTFDTNKLLELPYSTILTSSQAVIDFILGYEVYLKSQGFNFDRYDAENQVAFNWATSCKEFLFWTKQNWEIGSLITLSPAAQEVKINKALGVIDDLFDSFYRYEIYKSDGLPLLPNFLNVKRDFQEVSVSTVNTTDGIYFLRLHYVLKEHVTVFTDRTVFNDVIYDKTTGYRQDRIKSRGFRTVDWDGDYTSPGFLFDNVNIQQWQPFTDYRLGDIVSYKSYFWTSLQNQFGSETFDETIWTRLDVTPSKGLISNFDFRINQFEDYYDVDADGLGSSQRDLSRHVIGYQSREYLQNLAEDQVSQFKLYQGFIREKGTSNSIVKVFDKLSNTDSDSVTLNEEWAFRAGTFGGADQFTEVEFRLNKNDFIINPQPILIAPEQTGTDILDQYLRIPESGFTIKPIPFTKDINPQTKQQLTARTAGYVKTTDIEYVVTSKDDILNLNIANFKENDNIFVTFELNSWNVYRFNQNKLLYIVNINVNKTRVEIFTNRNHNFAVGDIFGITAVENLRGFYRAKEVSARTIVIEIDKNADEPVFDDSSSAYMFELTPARYLTFNESTPWRTFTSYNKDDLVTQSSSLYKANSAHTSSSNFRLDISKWDYVNDYSINLETLGLLTNGAKAWIDDIGDTDTWQVIEKRSQYQWTSIDQFGTEDPKRNGSAVLYHEITGNVISSMPQSDLVVVYIERTEGLRPLQLIQPPEVLLTPAHRVFGEKMELSPDGRWLAVSSPRAAGIPSNYQGVYDSNRVGGYQQGDIVLFNNKLWRASRDIDSGDGSTVIDITTDDWIPATIITANVDGTNQVGYVQQGCVSMYEWSGQDWQERYTFISPRPQASELFGSDVAISKNGNDYYMAVSAVGSEGDRGSVYLYKYAPLADNNGETVNIQVTVRDPVGVETGISKFYLDAVRSPSRYLFVGDTYVFDQSDFSNVYHPNPISGSKDIFAVQDLDIGKRYVILDIGDTDCTQAGSVGAGRYEGTVYQLTKPEILDAAITAKLGAYFSSVAVGETVTILEVTTVYSGAVRLGQQLVDSVDRIISNTTIQALANGTGGPGTYILNVSQEISETILLNAAQVGTDFYYTGTAVGLGGVAKLFSSTTTPHILRFSSDATEGENGGGTLFEQGVRYYLDEQEVTKEVYEQSFALATSRKIELDITETTPGVLFFYDKDFTGAGGTFVKRFPNIAREWKQLENHNYKGIYDPSGSTFYPEGSVVWADNNLWQSQVDQFGDGSTIGVDAESEWQQIAPYSVSSSLPANVSKDDGSSLYVGLFDDTSPIELVKPGDGYGHQVTMNYDGSLLVISAPDSDGQWFADYRGQWNPYTEYQEGQVVKHQGIYYQLFDPTDPNPDDSSLIYASISDSPLDGDPWLKVGDSTNEPSGKVFVYRRTDDIYKLVQTINSGNISDINDLNAEESVSSGDQFGFSIDIDNSGSVLVVSSPGADLDLINQGSVYVFRTASLNEPEYRLKQKLESFEEYNNEMFGYNVCISNRTERIVISAKNTPFRNIAYFDSNATTFDGRSTTFSEDRGFPGQVYVFELRDKTYLLAEKLSTELGENESFGEAIDCIGSVIVTGSPDYETTGLTRLFKKDPSLDSWTVIAEESSVVDIELLKSITLIDERRSQKIADVDIVDNNKFKVLGIAEQEIDYKTVYDPAIYSVGTESVSVDEDRAWFEKNVGKVWWDISKAKWINYEQGDVAFRAGNWNLLAEGASIDVYEWVESLYSPSDWIGLADTTEGLALGISGQPIYNGTAYSLKRFNNPNTGELAFVRYYFWVKNKTVVPDVVFRRTAVSDIARTIEDPAGQGLPVLAIIDRDKFLAYNFKNAISGDYALLNIEYYKQKKNNNNVHTEYQLLTEDVVDSVPSRMLEDKWLDSLIGYNRVGNPVPDSNLLPKQRYGIKFRPSQTMFVDRQKALQIVIENINTLLRLRPFTGLIDFNNLNQKEEIPDIRLSLYDLSVETLVDLAEVGTVRVRPAIISANLVDGQIDTVDIVDSGFGYKVAPQVEIVGDGRDAKVTLTIDNQGRVNSATVVLKGRKYSAAVMNVRRFSVLVENDSSVDNNWSIYSWDNERSEFVKIKVQSYDTTRFWSYVDWYAAEISNTTRILTEIAGIYLEPTISVKVGDIVRVKEYGSGGWALIEKTESGQGEILSSYRLVGRQNGTIQLNSSLYEVEVYDATETYDEFTYDRQPTQELRFIFKAVKENIFIDDLSVEWNKLFFASMRYVLSEQAYVDWMFKSSLLSAIHDVGELEQKTNYKNDNLVSYQNYIEEVKPFRTTIREYTSRYKNLDDTDTTVTDFDLPPMYQTTEGAILPVFENNSLIEQYPWKWWSDNRGFAITAIELFTGGSGYITPPSVVIQGNGTGASAQAYISNGFVIAIRVIEPGYGYTSAPQILLVGGNGNSSDPARAFAIIGDSLVRTLDIGIKFDRITRSGSYSRFTQIETFQGDGFSAVYELNYPPTRDKTKIKVFLNNELLLNSDYNITFYMSSIDDYDLLRGKLILSQLPPAGATVTIDYEKNIDILDSVDRINRLYAPTAGMIGKDVGQLMTGIDFGGVQIQGTTFDVSGGWDALPWFIDNWDSVESSSDFYISVDGSTTSITLPAAPALGQLISVYLKRADSQRAQRIDNFYYIRYTIILDDSSDNFKGNWKEFEDDGTTARTYEIGDIVRYKQENYIVIAEATGIEPLQGALMPTIVGDGSTVSFDINGYLRLDSGDIMIFRSSDSDGTVVINDVNIIDTRISGGSLSSIDRSYATATGMLAEDIVVEGGKFIDPDQVPAPEENIPGQVLESLSIKVYHTIPTGATPVSSKIYTANGNARRYDIGLTILEPQSVMVYVDKIKYDVAADSSLVEYSIDWNANQIVFEISPISGSIIEIFSVGVGGLNLLDYQEFEADGDTLLFLTRADYALTESVLVTVDGIQIDVEFIDSEGLTDNPGRTLVRFANRPSRRQIVKIIALGSTADTDSSLQSIVRVNQQTFVYDGSTRSFDLDRFVNLQRASAQGSIVVERNGVQLRGVDTEYRVYDGTNNVIKLGVDPEEPLGATTGQNIKVYVNNDLKRFVLDYVFTGPTNTLTVFPTVLEIGDEIKVENSLRAEYYVENNNLVLADSVYIEDFDDITVTWFSEYPTMDFISDQFSGGQPVFRLQRQPLSVDYIWVYKNGQRLTKDLDFEVSLPRSVIYMKDPGTPADEFKVLQFGKDIKRPPIGFEIYKDMLNSSSYNRFSRIKSVALARDLMYYDTEIAVTDASQLFDPVRGRNVPGVIHIDAERIEYFRKAGNVLSQLRRGSFGTAIREMHSAGTEIIDVSQPEVLPYNESQSREDLVSPGPLTLIFDGTSKTFELENILYAGNGDKNLIVLKINGIEVDRSDYTVSLGDNKAYITVGDDIEIKEDDVITSEVLIYELGYVPRISNRIWSYRETIPEIYGPCDEIEVFVAGRRLKKDPISTYSEDLGITSPAADITQEAEFSVDGINGLIRLTMPVDAGQRITVIKKTGKVWYDRGTETVTTGTTLVDNISPILQFLSKKSTELPE